jgi:hypothetical protein
MAISLQNITSGKVKRPPFGIVYGKGKIGKSTFCANAPKPIFIPTEDGTNFLDVARFPLVKTYEEVLECIKTLGVEEHDYKTVVLDSLDHLEPMVHDYIQRKTGLPLEKIGGGFYRWRATAREAWADIIGGLSKLNERKGMGVMLIAHYKVKDFADPRTDTYSRIMLKLDDSAAGYLSEVVDFIGFADSDVKAVGTNDEDRKRGIATGERKLFLVETPAFDAGNRMGLPASVPLNFDAFGMAWREAITPNTTA